MIKASFGNAFCLINKMKTYTAQNFVFSPNFLVWRFSENTVFPEFRLNRMKLYTRHYGTLCTVRKFILVLKLLIVVDTDCRNVFRTQSNIYDEAQIHS